MVRRNKTNYVIQSVAHALDVLEQFFGEIDELGVTELSKRLKLHKNNVFRLLATLEARGYIEQNRATENYRLGIKCLHLGRRYIDHMGLVRQARPILADVARRCVPRSPPLEDGGRDRGGRSGAIPRVDDGHVWKVPLLQVLCPPLAVPGSLSGDTCRIRVPARRLRHRYPSR